MKTIRFVLAIGLLLALLSGCAGLSRPHDTLFQVSTLDALLAGIYDGEATIGDVRHYGDFGIGTFAALDGEMVMLDGDCYQITADGVAHLVGPDTQTPFCAVTFFGPDISRSVPGPVDFPGLQKHVGEVLPTKNIFYAVKAHGTFNEMRVRSVPRQERPYPPLTEVVKDQPVHTFHDITGTLVGFVCPEYVAGVNVAGWHLHFIADDRSVGGHVLAFSGNDLVVEVDETQSFFLYLPTDAAFYNTDLSGDTADAIKRVEK